MQIETIERQSDELPGFTDASVDGDGVERKGCPICDKRLAVGEFGICRARKDGRNLYCKACIRKKVTDSRHALKEYRAARKRYNQPGYSGGDDGGEYQPQAFTFSWMREQLTPEERVKEAIRKGARTQKEIRKATGLDDDGAGVAIANLLLWTREIKSWSEGDNRYYRMSNDGRLPIQDAASGHDLPARKPDVQAGFSSIVGLMPARLTRAG